MPFLCAYARVRQYFLGSLPDDTLDLKFGSFPESANTLFGCLFFQFAEGFRGETSFLCSLKFVEDRFQIDRSPESRYAACQPNLFS